jgi:hypothetical protein
VKNESGAEVVLGLEEEELMGEISPPPQPVNSFAVGHIWRSKECLRDTTSPGNGQGLAVRG